jgi:hypothetical protein
MAIVVHAFAPLAIGEQRVEGAQGLGEFRFEESQGLGCKWIISVQRNRRCSEQTRSPLSVSPAQPVPLMPIGRDARDSVRTLPCRGGEHLQVLKRSIEKMVAQGADVPALGADCLEQLVDLRPDHFPGAGRDDVELIHAADQRDRACPFPGRKAIFPCWSFEWS